MPSGRYAILRILLHDGNTSAVIDVSVNAFGVGLPAVSVAQENKPEYLLNTGNTLIKAGVSDGTNFTAIIFEYAKP